LHESAVAVQTVHTGIVKSVRANEHIAILRKRELRQNLSQGLLP
jgi:hypothetical protein